MSPDTLKIVDSVLNRHEATKEPIAELIGNRTPWNLLFKATLHLRQDMSTLCWGRHYQPSCSAAYDAFNLIHECLSQIAEEGGAR